MDGSIIEVYPNPSNGIVNIKLPLLSNASYTITVTDIYGKIIEQKHLPNATGSTQLDIINGRGMYFMAITNDKTGVQKIEKVIIN